ncbi:MAG: hypothetical protein JSV88_05070 [Candidatus Aminicenantes bacterium]|nr:MAG: hypothetical protein JSV88_05070 [Candidatus Aminicenantes bacterium]
MQNIFYCIDRYGFDFITQKIKKSQGKKVVKFEKNQGKHGAKIIKSQGKHREKTIKSQGKHDRKRDKFFLSYRLIPLYFSRIKG